MRLHDDALFYVGDGRVFKCPLAGAATPGANPSSSWLRYALVTGRSATLGPMGQWEAAVRA